MIFDNQRNLKKRYLHHGERNIPSCSSCETIKFSPSACFLWTTIRCVLFMKILCWWRHIWVSSDVNKRRRSWWRRWTFVWWGRKETTHCKAVPWKKLFIEIKLVTEFYLYSSQVFDCLYCTPPRGIVIHPGEIVIHPGGKVIHPRGIVISLMGILLFVT